MYAWRYVSMVADFIVVIDCTSSIENNVKSNTAAWVDNCASADHTTQADCHVWSNNRTRVLCDDKFFALRRKRDKKIMAGSIVPNCHNYRIMVDGCQIIHFPQNGNTKENLANQIGIIIKVTNWFNRHSSFLHLKKNVSNDLCMSPGT